MLSLPTKPKLRALVLSGGGARGAYEAGVVHYLRTALPEPVRHGGFHILCGTSVGAVNIAYLAGTAHDPAGQGARLRSLWENLEQNRLFRRDWGAVAAFVAQVGVGLAINFLRFDPGRHRVRGTNRFVSLFDTSPLPAYLASIIDFAAIHRNVASGVVRALAVAATNLDTDNAELFLEKRPEVRYHDGYRVHEGPLAVEHVLASAAIPFVFPPVKVGEAYYCDGGARLLTPMSPAIHLGADRILVIGAHAAAERRFPPPRAPGEYPSPGRLIAVVTETLFEDRLQFDMEQLRRINSLIEWAQMNCPPEELARLHEHVSSRRDLSAAGLRRIDALSIQPSRDLGDVFRDELSDNPYLDKNFSPFERFAMRLFAIDPREGREVFSYLVFAPRYLRALFELGIEDGRRNHDALVRFFGEEALPSSFLQVGAAAGDCPVSSRGIDT